MKYLILFVLAVALLAFIPREVQAGPLGLFPRLDGHRVAGAARKAKGVLNVRPVRALFRSCGRGGCG